MEYTFVWKNDCWWLKINSPEQLFDYHDKTDSVWSREFYNLISSKEFGQDGKSHASYLAYAIGQYGANRGMNPIQATQEFRATVIGNQLDALLEYGEIYINPKGGYHFKKGNKDYSQFVRRKELIFPNYEDKDIRIKQFPGGEHWYAYIGDMQVRDGDIMKWNTYEEALKKAKKLVTMNN